MTLTLANSRRPPSSFSGKQQHTAELTLRITQRRQPMTFEQKTRTLVALEQALAEASKYLCAQRLGAFQ
jgi:hypothetical protein